MEALENKITQEIEDINDFGRLYRVLSDNIGIITDSAGRKYDFNYLKDKIERMRKTCRSAKENSDPVPLTKQEMEGLLNNSGYLDRITRKYGLRDQVEEMIIAENYDKPEMVNLDGAEGKNKDTAALNESIKKADFSELMKIADTIPENYGTTYQKYVESALYDISEASNQELNALRLADFNYPGYAPLKVLKERTVELLEKETGRQVRALDEPEEPKPAEKEKKVKTITDLCDVLGVSPDSSNEEIAKALDNFDGIKRAKQMYEIVNFLDVDILYDGPSFYDHYLEKIQKVRANKK